MGSEAAPREVEQGAGGELHGPDVSNGAVSEDSRGINEALQQTPAQAEAEVDDDEEDDEEEDDEEAEIQLGFAEEVERDDDGLMALEGGNWRDWDGGKIGGKPIWLDPELVPTSDELSCPSCQDPLSFILQIYCPLDEPAEAFHRALYLYCCRRPACTGPGCAKVLRCQLPRRNPYYVYDPDEEEEDSLARGLAPAVKTCQLCGLKADKTCSACRAVSYCSRAHQKEDWKAGHKRRCRGGASEGEAGEEEEGKALSEGEGGGKPVRRSVFPEYEIVIEEERGGGSEEEQERRRREDEELVKKYQDVVVDETDDDATLGQKDLNEASGAQQTQHDKQTLKFLARVREHPSQVLRYARWCATAPLWVSSEDQPGAQDVPPCPYCQAPRAFECQVMPQLLQYLRVDAAAIMPSAPGAPCRVGAMNWGTLAFFTCTKSCSPPTVDGDGAKRAYVEEFVWRQKPID